MNVGLQAQTKSASTLLAGRLPGGDPVRLLGQRTSSPAENDTHRHNEQEVAPANPTAQSATPGVSFDFMKIPLFPPSRVNRPHASSLAAEPPLPCSIQPKLAIGQVDDALEHEANRVADQVMLPAAGSRAPMVQPK
jgi:hypothetical protein